MTKPNVNIDHHMSPIIQGSSKGYTFTLDGVASIVVLVVITDVEFVVVVVVSCPMQTWRCATDIKSLIAAANDRILAPLTIERLPTLRVTLT